MFNLRFLVAYTLPHALELKILIKYIIILCEETKYTFVLEKRQTSTTSEGIMTDICEAGMK